MKRRRTEKEIAQESKLANFVRKNRKELGLTQEEFSLRVGVGLAFLKRLEAGEINLQMAKVMQVLEYFGASLVPTVGDQNE